MIIDAKDSLLGRVCTVAAKEILKGNKVEIVNCEECVVSGKRETILEKYHTKMKRGAPNKGPFFYRRPEMLVKRTIRGMVPWKRSRGRDAYLNVKCHIGVPENLKNEKSIVLENAHVSKIQRTDFMRMKEICKLLGAKI